MMLMRRGKAVEKATSVVSIVAIQKVRSNEYHKVNVSRTASKDLPQRMTGGEELE